MAAPASRRWRRGRAGPRGAYRALGAVSPSAASPRSAFFAHVFRGGYPQAADGGRGNPTTKKVGGKPYRRQSRTSDRQREAGSRAARHEESPPTRRTGDRAQVRGGRPSALEQKRHVVAGPMRCANPERGRSRPKRGRANPPRERAGRDSTRGHTWSAVVLHAPGDGPMERRNLTGARPRRQVVRRRARALDAAAEPNAGPNRRGLTPLSRRDSPATGSMVTSPRRSQSRP